MYRLKIIYDGGISYHERKFETRLEARGFFCKHISRNCPITCNGDFLITPRMIKFAEILTQEELDKERERNKKLYNQLNILKEEVL